MLSSLIGVLLFAPARFDLTILHTNDQHGHVLPFAYVEQGRSKDEQPSIGGIARRSTLIRRLKSDTRNPVIVVDGGDVATRCALVSQFHGLPEIDAMNAVGYELATVGNNEFKLYDGAEATNAAGAQAALLAAVKRSKFPWVCANALDGNGKQLPGVKPYVVRTWNGVKVGFLGLVTQRCQTYPQTKGWTFQDPIAAAKEWVPKVRRECDVLIAMTHIGAPLDIVLANKVAGIDAIVGADSHTFLYKPLTVKNPDGHTVPIVQDGEFGATVGKFDLWFEKDAGGKWKVVKFAGKLIPVDSKIADDRKVAKALEPYVKPYLKVVGHVPMGPSFEARLAATLQTFAEAMRSYAHVDVAIVSTDSFQDCFSGPSVRLWDVYASEPFRNDITTGTLTGAQIVEAGRKKGTVVSGPTLVADQTYRVAVMDYVAASYPLGSATPTKLDVRDAVVAYLRK